jgi:hypothetical protein
MSDTPATNAPAAPAPTTNVGETTMWLDGRILLAALKFASTDETRHVLNGVYCHVDFGAERIVVYATDGRRAVAMRVNSEGVPEHDFEGIGGEAPTSDRFIIPSEFVKRIKPLIGRGSEKNVQIEVQAGALDGKRRILAMSPVSKRGVIGETVEGIYPNVAAIFADSRTPLETSSATSQLFAGVNTEFIGEFGEMLNTLSDKGAGVLIYRAGGADRALLLRPMTFPGNADVEAIIMPMNTEDAEAHWERPAWISGDSFHRPASTAPADAPANAPVIDNMAVTIRTGETSVRIDGDGIHAEPAQASE